MQNTWVVLRLVTVRPFPVSVTGLCEKKGFGDGSWRFEVHKPKNLVNFPKRDLPMLTGKGIRGHTTRLVRNNPKICEMASSVILFGMTTARMTALTN